MIAFLAGKIINKGQGFVILKVNDVGYKIFINSVQYIELDIGQTAELYIHQHVREDALSLYGFKTMEELEMFELLLSITGIGPKSALGVISIASVTELKEYIVQGDPTLLTKVSGIGKKTAERVVLELREKVRCLAGTGTGRTGDVSIKGDEIDALMALGYSMSQAREALGAVNSGVKDSGERIREALKKLGK
jgi:Holliday junction DNA helicase RuvA